MSYTCRVRMHVVCRVVMLRVSYSPPETLTPLILTSRLALAYARCLRVLSVYGVSDITTSDDVRQYMGAIMQAVRPLLTLTGGIPTNNALYKPMKKVSVRGDAMRPRVRCQNVRGTLYYRA